VDLKSTIYKGVYWTAMMEVITKMVSLVSSILIARILLPSDFGVIAAIGIFISIAQVLVNSGMTTSLVRDAEIDDSDYNTVFYFNFLASIVLYGIIFFLAPFIANYFRTEVIVKVIRVLSLNLIIQSLYVVQFTKLSRELSFKKLTIYNLVASIIGTVVGLTFAYIGYGVWSLVILAISIEIIKVLIVFWKEKWRPVFQFSKEKFSKHFQFGYKMAASGLLNTVFNELYTFIIAKYYSISQLGYYNRANSLSQYPSVTLSSIVHKVSFPLLSTLKDDDNKLIEIQKKTMQAIMFVIAPILIISGVVAKPLFIVLFTDKWSEAAPMFQILAVNALLYPIHAFNLQVVGIKGRSDLFLKAELVKKILILVTVAISFVLGGLFGILYGSVVISFLALFVNMYFCSRVLPFGILEQIKSLIPVFMFCLVMSLIIYFMGKWIFAYQLSEIWSIFIISFISIIAYLLFAKLVKLSILAELLKFAK
jgi:teichuronic acid exporter